MRIGTRRRTLRGSSARGEQTRNKDKRDGNSLTQINCFDSFDANADADADAVVDEGAPDRIGATLETMKHLDSWSAATGKAFVDLPSTTKWRFSLFDPKNGNMATTELEESVVLSRVEQYAAKMKLQYTSAAPTASTKNIIHRQGARLLCDKRFYTAFVTVMVTPGPANSNSLYIDLTATVKMPRETREGGGFNRTQSKDPGLVKLTKRISTYEARERLNMSSFAPALDLGWWQDPKRGEMWRNLIELLVLVPFVEVSRTTG